MGEQFLEIAPRNIVEQEDLPAGVSPQFFLKLLTPREERVVALLADGLSHREIGQELQFSEHSIKKYLFRIFEKLGISSGVELVLYAVSNSHFRPAEWLAGAVG